MSQRTTMYCPLGSTTVTSLWDALEWPFLDCGVQTQRYACTERQSKNKKRHTGSMSKTKNKHALLDSLACKRNNMNRQTCVFTTADRNRVNELKSIVYHNRSWKLKQDLLFVWHSYELRTQCLKNTIVLVQNHLSFCYFKFSSFSVLQTFFLCVYVNEQVRKRFCSYLCFSLTQAERGLTEGDGRAVRSAWYLGGEIVMRASSQPTAVAISAMDTTMESNERHKHIVLVKMTKKTKKLLFLNQSTNHFKYGATFINIL